VTGIANWLSNYLASESPTSSPDPGPSVRSDCLENS
jgi:hypothetical protein